MTYQPKPDIPGGDLEALVSQRILELLSSIKSISTLYVEPNDTVIITMPSHSSEQDMAHIKSVIKTLFPENKGVILLDDIKINVIRKE